MEDLGLSDEGRAPADILAGRYDRDGAQPCQIDGGLKCFGHPVGASGLRMAFEVYSQLLGRAGPRQLARAIWGLLTISAARRSTASPPCRSSDG